MSNIGQEIAYIKKDYNKFNKKSKKWQTHSLSEATQMFLLAMFKLLASVTTVFAKICISIFMVTIFAPLYLMGATTKKKGKRW